MSKLKLFLLVIDLILIRAVISSNVHYVIPSPTTQCPDEPCLTLSILAANSNVYFDSNATMIFLEGSHILESRLVVSNIDGSLVLLTNSSGTVAIICSGRASLEFFRITQLQISGLEFIRCSSKVELVDQFTLENSRFHDGNDDSALHLTHTNTSIVRSSFASNTAGTHQSYVGLFGYLRDNNYELPYPQPNIPSNSARVGGALIVTSSNVDIISSCFESNTAKIGGAVFSQFGSNINISNCTFVNNSATGCSDAQCHGGALFIDSGCTVIAHNSTFVNNTARYSGGAVALFQGKFLDSIHNVFSSNRADRYGGAISAYSRSRVTIDNSCYSYNRGGSGGAIYTHSYGGTTVSNSSFDNNEARNDGGVMYAYYSGSITVSDSSFDNNEARDDGGVMYAYNSGSITVSDSSFDDNEARSDGGVMYAYYSGSITVSSSSFDNNVAGYDGGVMYAFASSIITVGNSSFDNNEAGDDGGVICTYNSDGIIVGNSYFDNNKADHDGGVMSLQQSSSIAVGNSSFNNSKAGHNGGIMSAQYNSSITVGNSSFDNNVASYDGGVMSAQYSSSITMRNSSFNNSKAGHNGGIMSAQYNSSITVGNSSFDNNVASYDGGVMSAQYSSSITMRNSSFDNNVASYDGGVMSAQYSSSITMRNSSFDNNVVGYDGGVVYAFASSSITVRNSSFDNNEAGDDGGVMSAQDSSSITVRNSSFDNNVAGDDGGVMHASINSRITVGNNSFDNNTVCRDGGVVSSTTSTKFHIIFKNDCCTFFNNSANEGGVVFVRDAYFIDLGSMYCGNMAVNGGVITLNGGSIKVTASRFMNNTAKNSGGVLYTPLHRYEHVMKLETSYLNNNNAISGGAIAILSNATIILTESIFTHNNAIRGGAIYLLIGNDLIASYSYFFHNLAKSDGGVIYSEDQSRLKFKNCELNFNRAERNGGVVCLLFQSELNISGDNCFIGNLARSGGVAYASESTINIQSQTLLMTNNTAIETGGAVYSSAATLTFFGGNHMLVGNQAHSGGAVYARESIIYVYSQSLLMANNLAIDTGGAAHVFKTDLIFFRGNNRLVQNQAHSGGALYVINSRVEAYNESLLMANNTARDSGGAVYLSKANLSFIGGNITFVQNKAAITGGAMRLTEGQLIFSGSNSMLIRNNAIDGGAMYASESKIIVETESQTKIFANSAVGHGGALYLTTVSELKIKGESSYITRNRATNNGGGIHATNSSVIVEGAVYFVSNAAKNGGGISLEKSAKLRGTITESGYIDFVTNRASHYGGALYVDDETNPDMCAAVNVQSTTSSILTESECFSKLVFVNMSDNYAGVSGSNLFGGLLDRCTVLNELSQMNELGIMSFQNLSNINNPQLDTISSHPVQLCFCRDGRPDCNYQPDPIQVNGGKLFSVELIAYDQVHHAVNASIQCFLNSSAGGLGEGQQSQTINKYCTELKYKLFTPNNYEGLIFSAVRGPCNNISGVSERSVMIKIICSCSIGFQTSNNNGTSCDCVCDQVLQSYKKTECNSTTESVIRRENFWISYINHTWSNSSGYVIYPHCPFDYCYTPDLQVSINLNLPNGSDAQCDSNRMGVLCGTCKPGLSVSIGSSKCVTCPTYWPALLVTITIVFIISGVGLVAFLLVLNLTVAIGTLNAIIFYANIVIANKSTLFPSRVSFASVFISWLNFDLGFDVCIFDGMDKYTKTWLQLAFPAYIIILVAMIIVLSYYFSAFGRLVGKKDPVATLATLILLSYTKLLQTIITAFSSATLVYPDGSKKTLWLPDATIEYFTSKHAVMFFTAILILFVGLIYTLLVLSWQWFLSCPRKRVKWIRNQKLSSFMEIYHVPYTPRHRYWTGLLLLVRVSVYLVSAFNPSGDPRLTLSVTNFIISSLVIYIATFGVRMYTNRFINIMEILTYFNLIALSVFTWYTIDAGTNQIAVTNISVGIIFVQLTAVIIYHAYKQKMFKRNAIYIKIKDRLTQEKQKRVNGTLISAGEDILRFHKLLNKIDRPVSTNDYSIPQVKPKPAEPTQSVVELPTSDCHFAPHRTVEIPPSDSA